MIKGLSSETDRNPADGNTEVSLVGRALEGRKEAP